MASGFLQKSVSSLAHSLRSFFSSSASSTLPQQSYHSVPQSTASGGEELVSRVPFRDLDPAETTPFVTDMDDSGKGAEALDRPDESTIARVSSPLSIVGSERSSLYERKCVIVNDEFDRMGMGRYQWCVWSLCGFGYFIDLLWAQAYGLVLSPVQQEFGFGGGHSRNPEMSRTQWLTTNRTEDQSGNIASSFSAGLTAGP